ncbi:VOC family protein [Gordonia rubripertincta]|uniref:VOC family protein n=1 Tax=Gordonia rubripertincta TaxID=36822 RepID=A0ABT4MWC7_GORRU|nr:VOC family protein [Gordonia rubripertincta]MCZ4551313.1 VOC family protein [Gordonia rubripertincta]
MTRRKWRTTVKAEDLFHMGIVSDDPSATREQLTALLGYEWGPTIGGPTAVTLTSGEVTLEFACSYSISTPRLEVVNTIPGTFWEPVAGSGIHHLGYWSDDVGADTEDLVRGGYVVEATRSAGGAPFFAFLRGDNGIRMELVTRSAEPMMQPCWAAQS